MHVLAGNKGRDRARGHVVMGQSGRPWITFRAILASRVQCYESGVNLLLLVAYGPLTICVRQYTGIFNMCYVIGPSFVLPEL